MLRYFFLKYASLLVTVWGIQKRGVYFLKLAALLILLSILGSCRFKEMMDNDFKSESKVTPFAKADTLAQRFGNGRTNTFTLKIPLTESSIGYFDIDEVLGNDSLDRDQQSFLSRMANGFKMAIYNIALRMGIRNKFKITSYFNLPEINPKFVESARVKKVFFTTEDCRPEDVDCDDTKSSEGNFNFIEKFFVNLRLDKSSEETRQAIKSKDGEVDSKIFKKAVSRSFSETMESAVSDVMMLSQAGDIESLKADNQEINIMKFENQVPDMNLDTSGVQEDDRELLFQVSRDKGRVIRDYLKSSDFKTNYVSRVQLDRDGVYVKLHKHITPSVFFERISRDQSPLTQKMFIFRLEGGYVEAKHYFEKDKFKNLVKDTTMIGRSLYVELYSVRNKSEFLRLIDEEGDKATDYFDIYRRETCSFSNCLDIDALPINVGPLLTSGKDIRIDTWLSIRSLGSRDFKYNGYIEIEVVLKNLPI